MSHASAVHGRCTGERPMPVSLSVGQIRTRRQRQKQHVGEVGTGAAVRLSHVDRLKANSRTHKEDLTRQSVLSRRRKSAQPRRGLTTVDDGDGIGLQVCSRSTNSRLKTRSGRQEPSHVTILFSKYRGRGGEKGPKRPFTNSQVRAPIQEELALDAPRQSRASPAITKINGRDRGDDTLGESAAGPAIESTSQHGEGEKSEALELTKGTADQVPDSTSLASSQRETTESENEDTELSSDPATEEDDAEYPVEYGAVQAASFSSWNSHLGPSSQQQSRTPHAPCACCGKRDTPLWRDIPMGHPHGGTSLCNACGIRYKKYGVYCPNCSYVPDKRQHRKFYCPRCHHPLPPAQPGSFHG